MYLWCDFQGPDEDAEPESQFTVTELLQQKRDREQEKLRMEALKIAEEKALEEKRRIDEENAGIDWGMGKRKKLKLHQSSYLKILQARMLTRKRT